MNRKTELQYVASYHVRRYKISSDLTRLEKSIRRIQNLVPGSCVMYRILDDGNWELLTSYDNLIEGGANEIV